VVAIDTDSNPNLGLSLGLTLSETEAVPVLPRAVLVGSGGGEPSAAELVSQYGRPTPAGPTLLSAIRVTEAGAGCTCSGHATVRNLLGDALVDVDVTLVDMEAGLEHLSRSGGTLAYADVLVVVCEPTRKSVLTAGRTAALAAELGIGHVLALGNKSRTPEDGEFLDEALAEHGIPLVGVQVLERGDSAHERVPGGVELPRLAFCHALHGQCLGLFQAHAEPIEDGVGVGDEAQRLRDAAPLQVRRPQVECGGCVLDGVPVHGVAGQACLELARAVVEACRGISPGAHGLPFRHDGAGGVLRQRVASRRRDRRGDRRAAGR
jgi:CO dehydrogenase maturation factor